MKWEPAAAMVAVVALGAWLVWGPPRVGGVQLREGARLVEMQLGDVRGVVEVLDPPGDQAASFRIVTRDGQAGSVLSREQFASMVGPDAADRLAAKPGNPLFKLLKITSWTNVLWVLLGLGGQMLFSARMLLQWVASERSGKNVITVSFWWISLIAGLILFTYFAWRQDIVGVLGQSTGLVVYARNVKLHYKNAKRAARRAAAPTAPATTPAAAPAPDSHETIDPRDDPDPSAVPMVEMPEDSDRPARRG